MPTPTPDITADDWPRVKSLWFAVQDAEPAARAAVLDDPSVEPRVRHHVERLLAASSTMGNRFETPAIAGLGGSYTPPDTTLPSLIGRRLGPYDVVRRIGQGGMGAVYEAVRADDAFEQRVAIKTIWRGADSTVLLQRFRSERQILAGLQHPNIAVLVDGGATEEGTPWLAMEYVVGVPIDEYCDAHALGLPARLDLFRQVCAAVHFAHRSLVVHRDLKPSNVLVTADGTVKLLDFGVAKLLDDPRGEGTLTGAGLTPFTASYAAPEQVTGARISTATDVYSLGALLVTLIAGEPPLDSRSMSPGELMDAVRDLPASLPSEIVRRGARNTTPDDSPALRDTAHAAANDATPAANAVARARGFPNAEKLARALSGELDAIALMALRKEPDRRYSGADALADDVRRYLRRDRVLARPDTFGYRIRSVVRRQRPLVMASVGGLLVLLAAVATVSWQESRRQNEQLRADDRLREVRTLVSVLVNDANDQLADIPGATQARANLVRSAMLALDNASTDAPRDSTLLRELAFAYSRAADVLGNPTQANLGDLKGAAAGYGKAIGIAEALMRQYPDDPSSAWTLALVYEKAADVEAPIGHLPTALEHQRASLALFRRISAADTSRYGATRAVGISALKTGDLLGHPSFTNTGDTSAAIAAYLESVQWLERASAQGDTAYITRRHRAVARERLGRLMQERRDFDGAKRWLEESLQIRDALALESPRSVQARRDVAIALYVLCGLHLANAQPDSARAPCERSLEIRKELLAEDPKSSVLVRGMGIMHGRLGAVYATAGDSSLALQHYGLAAGYYNTFFGGRAGALNDRRDYAQIQLQRAAVADAMATPASSRVAGSAYAAVIASMDSIKGMAPLSAQDSVALGAARRGLTRPTAERRE